MKPTRRTQLRLSGGCHVSGQQPASVGDRHPTLPCRDVRIGATFCEASDGARFLPFSGRKRRRMGRPPAHVLSGRRDEEMESSAQAAAPALNKRACRQEDGSVRGA
jgi:hypothetical protein